LNTWTSSRRNDPCCDPLALAAESKERTTLTFSVLRVTFCVSRGEQKRTTNSTNFHEYCFLERKRGNGLRWTKKEPRIARISRMSMRAKTNTDNTNLHRYCFRRAETWGGVKALKKRTQKAQNSLKNPCQSARSVVLYCSPRLTLNVTRKTLNVNDSRLQAGRRRTRVAEKKRAEIWSKCRKCVISHKRGI
jgi:hypothetical protein